MNFAAIQFVRANGPVEPYQYWVLLSLALFADDAWEAFPSALTLGEDARISERKVYYTLKLLEAGGWVCKRPSTGRKPSRYVLARKVPKGAECRTNDAQRAGFDDTNDAHCAGLASDNDAQRAGLAKSNDAPQVPQRCTTGNGPITRASVKNFDEFNTDQYTDTLDGLAAPRGDGKVFPPKFDQCRAQFEHIHGIETYPGFTDDDVIEQAKDFYTWGREGGWKKGPKKNVPILDWHATAFNWYRRRVKEHKAEEAAKQTAAQAAAAARRGPRSVAAETSRIFREATAGRTNN